MINKHVVVDGSNIATEGRTLPSLSQLDEAVRSFQDEFPAAEVTVVVDATFGHRIDDSEKPTFEEAVLAGELVSPPAGAIGRGDAFVLSIANKAEATVFSNDSFQEFHGQYTWLFDEGRLVGGKPVPGVGWVFVLRAPVRGPLSRRSTRDARVSTAKKAATKAPTSRTRAGLAETPRRRSRRAAAETAAVDTTGGAAVGAAVDVAPPVDGPPVDEPVVEATDTLAAADASAEGSGRGRRRRPTKQVEPINEPLPFLQFVSAHPVGSVVDGTVDRFSSHGAYVVIDSAQCYLPLRSMADPPPKSAKEVLNVGETRSFVVEAFESPRRSIDLAIPGFETVTAAPAAAEDDLVEHPPAEEAPTMASPKKTPTKKAAAKKTTAKKTTSARKTTGAKAAVKKAATKKATAKKSAAKKTTPAKKTTGTKKATAKKTTATKTGKATARKATAKKATARKAAAKKSTAKKAAATKKR